MEEVLVGEYIQAIDIQGEMGGGKGGGHTPREADDTLSSTQTARLLLLLGEGEIQSVDEIYLNKTPISSFSGATFESRTGLSNQTPCKGFGEVQTPATGFSAVQVTTSTSYVKAFDYDVTAVKITFSLSSLRMVQDNGDIVGYKVDLNVETKATPASSFVVEKNVTKAGKASSPYAWDVRIDRPSSAVNGQQWSIRVNRLTADDADVKHSSLTSVAGLIEIRHPITPYTYPNSVLLALTLADASQFGGRMPDITIRVKGEKVYLPTNYNATTRVYTGNPTGAFKTAKEYTNNPIWILWHVLVQRMFIPSTDLDFGSFYEAAQYADESISNGDGGTEPRYTINNAFIRMESPYTFFTYILTICNANFATNEFGQLSLILDKPGRPITKLVTNANVIDGEFSYSSNDLESRFTSVNVTYNEPTQLGETQTTTFTDNNLITRYGLQTSNIPLAGCYSEAQAIRKARWAVWTNSYDTDFISFKNMLAGGMYYVGELINILDNKNSGFDCQGLISSSSSTGSSTTLVLDRSIALSNTAYTIMFLDSAGNTVSQPINQANGTFNTVTFGSVSSVFKASPFILSTATQKPITARVIKIDKRDDIYEISCVKHNEGKYAYIDGAVAKVPRPSQFVNLSNFSVTSPVNVGVSEVFSSNGVTKGKYLHVTWDWVKGSQGFNPRYTVQWRRDNQNFQMVENISVKNFDIFNPAPGQYEIYVFATNPISSVKSAASTSFIYNYRTVAAGSTLEAPTTVRVQGTTGLTFANADLNLEILHNPNNNNKTDKLNDYIVEVWTADGATKKGTFVVPHRADYSGLFTLTYYQNIELFGTATRTFQIKVYCRDMVGDLSSALAVTVNNPVPAAVNFTVLSGVGINYINIDTAPGSDIAGYEVHRSTTSGFTPSLATKVYTGASNTVTVSGAQSTTYYFKCAAYDTFDQIGLNYGTQIAGTTLANDAIDWKIISGLQFTQNSPTTNSISWTSGVIVKITGSTSTTFNISAGSAAWTSGNLYIYFPGSGTTLSTTTTLSTAVSANGWVIGDYLGGTTFNGGTGQAFVDGSKILAGTVGANQLIAGSAVITGSAQIADAIITNTKIANAAITGAKIGTATITGANIAAATIQSANIGTAQVSTLHIGANAVTVPSSAYRRNPIRINAVLPTATQVYTDLLKMSFNISEPTNSLISFNLHGWTASNNTPPSLRIYKLGTDSTTVKIRMLLNSSIIYQNSSGALNKIFTFATLLDAASVMQHLPIGSYTVTLQACVNKTSAYTWAVFADLWEMSLTHLGVKR